MRLLSSILISLMAITAHAEQPMQKQMQIDFIEQNFKRAHDHSQAWQWGWFGFLGGATIVQTIGANTLDDDKIKYDMGVGAVTSFLGTADMLLNPMQSHIYSDQLQSINRNSDITLDTKLRQAESWLDQAAARETYEQSLTNHLLSGLVNGLAALVIAYDDKRPTDAWVSFATGMAVSEIKIYTAPQTMIKAKADYQKGHYQIKTAKADQQRLFVAAAGPNLWVNWKF